MRFSNWVLEPDKYLNKEQARRLLKTAESRAMLARDRNQKTVVRDYFVIHLGLSTGLRVMEIAALKCSDIFLDEKLCSVLVRRGKGGKKRMVYFTGPFREHCRQYFKWKQQVGEPVDAQAPLIASTNTKTHMTTRALQKLFKRSAKRAHMAPHFSIHCLRHTYACFLLKASNWNLRLVQKQLGHSRISTTQVYADVMMPDIKKALENLYK
jgi:site-specific recombinase XerD